jgi:outer membrane lipoprotein LolB
VIARRAALAAATVMLASCALPPPGAAPSLLSGRLALRVDSQPPQSFSADFELRGDAREGSLRLAGPLGTTTADARWSREGTWLVTSQGRSDYASLDELTTAALGEPVPLAALFDWLRGRPWPGAPSLPQPDRTAGFDQLGWRIDLSRWAERWIEAQRQAPPKVTLRARMEPPA